MGNEARLAGSIIQTSLSKLSPSPNSEKLVFRRFKGYALAQAAINGTTLRASDIQVVTLRINPASVGFSKKKVIQKIQTSAPGRFVVFDWGTELTMLDIVGNTGILLPDDITSGTNPLYKVFEAVAKPADIVNGGPAVAMLSGPGTWGNLVPSGAGEVATTILQNALMNNSTYFELLNMSPKYKTFKELEKMYDLADADSDVITLTFGDAAIYRGFFEDFKFDMTAESPWNWKYTISFVIMSDLSAAVRRWDDQFNPSKITG